MPKLTEVCRHRPPGETVLLSEIGLVAPLGALVIVAFLYLRRLDEGPATTVWGAAWIALYVTGTIAALDTPSFALRVFTPVLGSLFPALLLAGALILGRARWVAWPIAVGVVIGAVRAALVAADRAELSLLIAVPCELPLSVGAAAVAWRAARERPRSFPEQLMGPALMLLALVNAADPLARLADLSMIPLVLCWLTASMAVALLQAMTFLERIRERERRLLAERELLHQVARMASCARDEAPEILERVVTAVASLATLDGLGIWPLEANGTHLHCAARLRRIDDIPDVLSRLPIDDPLVQRALTNPEPLTIVDLRSAGDTLRQRAIQWGVGITAAAPLRVSGRTLGVVFAALVPGRCFEANDCRLLASLAQEIALVLAHAEAMEQRARQAGAVEDERRTLRELIEAVPAGILLADRQGQITMLSRLGAEHYGLTDAASWVGRSTGEAFAQFAHRLRIEEPNRPFPPSTPFTPGRFADRVFELHFTTPQERILEIALRELRPEDPEAARQLWVSRDVTEKRRSGSDGGEPGEADG